MYYFVSMIMMNTNIKNGIFHEYIYFVKYNKFNKKFLIIKLNQIIY